LRTSKRSFSPATRTSTGSAWRASGRGNCGYCRPSPGWPLLRKRSAQERSCGGGLACALNP
jgi:hypothetical protein